MYLAKNDVQKMVQTVKILHSNISFKSINHIDVEEKIAGVLNRCKNLFEYKDVWEFQCEEMPNDEVIYNILPKQTTIIGKIEDMIKELLICMKENDIELYGSMNVHIDFSGGEEYVIIHFSQDGAKMITMPIVYQSCKYKELPKYKKSNITKITAAKFE